MNRTATVCAIVQPERREHITCPMEKNKLLDIYNKLYANFGPQYWWPAETTLEIIVGAILTQNTAWSNVQKAINCLKQENLLRLDRLAKLPVKKLERLIRSSGYFRQKARRLKNFLNYLEKTSAGDLEKYFSRSLPALRRELLEQKGLGPETADSILLYAGNKPVFVIDAYTRRIGERIGLFNSEDYHWIQNYFQKNLPNRRKLYQEYHALLVALAKNFCRSKPVCLPCPMKENCNYAETTD